MPPTNVKYHVGKGPEGKSWIETKLALKAVLENEELKELVENEAVAAFKEEFDKIANVAWDADVAEKAFWANVAYDELATFWTNEAVWANEALKAFVAYEALVELEAYDALNELEANVDAGELRAKDAVTAFKT